MKAISITIALPPLSTEQAISLWESLHQVADAIWEVHGDAMVDVFAHQDLLEPLPDEPCSDNPDDDVPF